MHVCRLSSRIWFSLLQSRLVHLCNFDNVLILHIHTQLTAKAHILWFVFSKYYVLSMNTNDMNAKAINAHGCEGFFHFLTIASNVEQGHKSLFNN